MCGRFTLRTPLTVLIEHFRAGGGCGAAAGAVRAAVQHCADAGDVWSCATSRRRAARGGDVAVGADSVVERRSRHGGPPMINARRRNDRREAERFARRIAAAAVPDSGRRVLRMAAIGAAGEGQEAAVLHSSAGRSAVCVCRVVGDRGATNDPSSRRSESAHDRELHDRDDRGQRDARASCTIGCR